MQSGKMEGGREHLLLIDGGLGPQSAQEANQEGVRKSSRQRKQSKKALSLSQSNWTNSRECLEPPVKNVVKKRSGQQWNVCRLCQKFLPKKDRNIKKSGIAVSDGATDVKASADVLKNICTKCANAIEREKRAKKPSKADREKFEAEGVSFGEDLAKVLKDPEAKRLYCPFYQVHPCGCVQKYISGDLWKQKKIKQKSVSDGTVDLVAPGESADSKDRGLFLLSLRKESLRKRREIVNARRLKNKAERDLMFPEEFTQFLLSRRLVLRRAGLCERGCQRVLGYSNNFLHKKVMNGPRLPPSKGRAVGVLIKLEDLPSKTCCSKKCVKMAENNVDLLATWRHQAARSQKLSREVIRDMFTPDEKKHVNCPTFVGMVTGSCKSKIMKIKTNMILAGDSKQALEREKGKVQLVSGNSDSAGNVNQSRISAGMDEEAILGSSLTHANIFDGKTSSPSHAPALLTRSPMKCVVPQPSLEQPSPFKLLEDRHKKEREELKRKQQEEVDYYQQLHHSQQKQQQQQGIVLEQAEFDQNVVQAHTPVELCNAGLILPLGASRPQSSIPLADFKVPAVSQAFNPANVKITVASGHSLNTSSPFSSTQNGTSQSCSVTGVMDKNRNPMTSQALPLLLAKPSSLAPGTSFQQSFSLPPSLGAHTVLVLGSETVASTSRLSATSSCKSKDKKTGASSYSAGSTFGTPELLGHLVATDKMSLSSQTPQMRQSKTNIVDTSLQTSINQFVHTSDSEHSGNSLPAVNLLIGGNVLSQSAQNLQGHTIANNQSHLPEGINALSHSTQNVVDRTKYSAAFTQEGSPASFQSTLSSQQVQAGNGTVYISSKDVGCASSTNGNDVTHDKTLLGPKSHALREILPASDLQSVEGNTLTYSNVSLTRDTVVSSSSQKGQIGSNVSTLNAKTPRVNLENNTVSKHALVDSATSVPSSLPTVNGMASDEQHSLTAKSYLLSENGQIYCILQGESHCLERQQTASIASTVSTTIFQTVSQPSSSTTSYVSKTHFTSPLLVDSTMHKANAPSVSSQYQASVSKPTVQSGSSTALKNEVDKKGQESEKAKSISTSSSAQISVEDANHFAIKLGHHKNRTTRDKSQPVVGIVHPHVTQSKSGPVQEEMGSSQATRTLTPSCSLGNGQNHIISPISMEQSQRAARETNQMTLPQGRIVPSQSSTSSILSQTFSNPFSCILSHGSQVNQHMDPNHRHQVIPLHQQQTNFNQSVPLRPQGIALPRKLTLSEEQLQLILGTCNQPSQQTLTQEQHNAVPQEFLVGERLQQSQQAQMARTCHSLQPNMPQQIKPKSQVGFTDQLSEHQQAGVQTEGFHILAGGQSMENMMLSSSSVLHTESNNLQDLQPTIQLLSGPTHNEVVTQVLMPCQSNLLNPLASSEPQLTTELREAPTHRDYYSSTNQQTVPNSSTTQATRTEIPLLVSLSSKANNHSTRDELTENNSSQIVLTENVERYGSDQIQQVNMTKDGNAVLMSTTDGQTYQSLSMNDSAKESNLIRSSLPQCSNGQTEQGLSIKGSILKTSNILESSKDTIQSPLFHCNALIPLNNADNFNTTVSIDLEQNGPSSSTNSNFTFLPCPIQQSFETVSTSQISADGTTAMNFSQQLSDGKACIQMPSHEVPVIQHTLDKKNIVVLAGNNDGSFPLPMSSTPGNQQIIISFPFQDSRSTSPFVSPLNSSSVMVPILDENNGPQLICSEPAPLIQDAETQRMMKPVRSIQKNQELQNRVTTDAQNVQHILSNVHHEHSNAQNQVTHPAEASSHNNESLKANYSMSSSQTSQYPFTHTSKQQLSKTQGDQQRNYTQTNQMSRLGRKATSTGGLEESASSASKSRSSSREANSSSRPTGNTVILVPDKPGFPRYQVTQLSPEPDKQHVFNESLETAPGSFSVVATAPTTQTNVSLPHNETILQMIAQSLMSQNLSLTNGTQIVLPFQADIPESPASVMAKYEVTSRQDNKSITPSQVTLRDHSMQEEMETFSSISDKFHQHHPNSESEGGLNKAVKTMIQTGAGSSESSMIRHVYGKLGDEQPAGNSTHIIGDTKIGSLVKTRDDNKISDSTTEVVMEMLKNNNASSVKINLPEVNSQASLTFLEKRGPTSQSMVMVPVGGYKNSSSKIQKESVRLNISSPHHFVENNPDPFSQAVANVTRMKISNLPSVRPPDKNSDQSHNKISAQGSSEQNTQQLSFLHDKGLLIDITDEDTKPSQGQEYGITDQPATFQVQVKASTENQMALDTSSFLPSHVQRDKKSESMTLPERICVPPIVDSSSSNVSSLGTLLENPETYANLLRLLKNPSELQSLSSVILSKDNSQDAPHSIESGDTTLRVEYTRERPCSLSQINLNEVAQKGEMQTRRRTRSIGTPGTNGSSKKLRIHPYSTTSLPSSAVTFTRDTATTDDSAGPPNVTLVSPTSLKRKQLEELENAAALSQNRNQRTGGLLIVTPSQLPNEENQSDAHFSLSVSHPSASRQYGTLSVVDASKSLVVSKTNTMYNTDIMSTNGESNTLFARQTLNTQNQRNCDADNNESLFMSSSPACASQQNKSADKRSVVKPRKHSKPPTIRDILSLKESNKTQTLALSMPLEEMQYIVPVSGNVKLLSSNTQILSTEEDKNASHNGLAFDVEGNRSSIVHTLPEISTRVNLMTGSTNYKHDHLQSEVREKMHTAPHSGKTARDITTSQTEDGKTLRRLDNRNIITSRVSSSTKCNDCCKASSTEIVCPHVGPSIHEVKSRIALNPDHDLKSVSELTTKDQITKIDGPGKVKKDADLLSVALTKPTSKCRLTQSESPTTNVLSHEAVRARRGIHQICNSKVISSVTHSSQPISHHISSLSPGTKTLNTSPKNSILSELIAKHPDQLIGCTSQQQYTTSSKNLEEGVVRASLVSAVNNMDNEKEPSVKVVREDGQSRWRPLGEDKKMKNTPNAERSELVSSNVRHCFVDTNDDLGKQPQKLPFFLVNVSPSKELSCLDTGAYFKPNESITGRMAQPRIASPLASSVTSQSFSSVLATPLNSPQSLLVTTSHNISQYGDMPNVYSQLRPEASISGSLQNSTPLLTHMLQSSPAPLRSGAHKRDEKNASMMWKDSSTDKGDEQPSIQKSSLERDDQKCSVVVFEPSVNQNNSFSASIHDRIPLQSYTETLSASCTEIPKVTMSDRITQVIDNMYKRPDEVIVSSSADQPHSRMSQAADTAQSCTSDKKQLHSKQRCRKLEDDTHNTMLKRRKTRKRTISENSGPDVAQGSSESVYNSDHPCKDMQSLELSSSESKSGKRTRSKKEGSSRDRKKGTKSVYPGRYHPKRVQFSDIVTNEDRHIETPDDKSSPSYIRGTAPIMSSSVSALKDNTFFSSNLLPSYSQGDSNTLFKSGCVNEKETTISTNFTPSSHNMVMHQNILPGDHNSAVFPQKDHYSLGIDLQQGSDNNDGMDSSFWPQQSSEDLSRRETLTDILRHFHRPLSLPRNFEPRKEAEGIVGHSFKNDAKPMKMIRSATESLTVSPGQSYSANHPIPEYSIAEGKEGMERNYQIPWAYSGEHESSFEIISAPGYSKLSQKLKRRDPSTTMSSTEHNNCLLPSSSATQISSSKDTDYLESSWQEVENADVEISKVDSAMDPSVKRQKALQSDYKLAQQMAQHPSQTRSRHPSQEVNDQSLDSGSSYIPQSAFTESSLQEFYENSFCMRSLYTTYQENVRLKHAVALATENHSHQRNLSAADKQKNVACSNEIDFLRRNSSMPSSPFEPDNIRKSPRAMILGKYGSSVSLQPSHGRHPSSQESRSRNASGSHGLSQHYGESDIPLAKLMEVDTGLGDSFHTPLNHNCFVPLSNQDVTLDVDPIPGQIDLLRLRNYQDIESDVHNRHRNLSSSSIKSALIDSVIEFEHGSRSRNPSASSLLRYIDHGNIRSRNPSGSSNRRSRPGSCSSDREFPEMDMFSLLRNSPFNQAWLS